MPPLAARLSAASGLLKSGCSLVAAMPSAAILTGVVPIPASVLQLTEYITSVVTVALVLAILLAGEAIDRLPKAVTAVLILLGSVGGGLAAIGYYSFTSDHVVRILGSPNVELIIPSSPSPELRTLMAPYDDDYSEALATSIQRERITELVNRDNSGTILEMITLLVAAQILIVSAVVIGAWRLAHGETVSP